MALPILQITKLLTQLTVLAPVATDGIDKIRKLVETIRRGGGSTVKLDDLKQAIELQNSVNKEVDDQLRIIESVLENVQKSLKVLAFTTGGIGIVAVVALVVAFSK
jgi:predicted PurR-regulated permease PerM